MPANMLGLARMLIVLASPAGRSRLTNQPQHIKNSTTSSRAKAKDIVSFPPGIIVVVVVIVHQQPNESLGSLCQQKN
jgi:hypothetical protein